MLVDPPALAASSGESLLRAAEWASYESSRMGHFSEVEPLPSLQDEILSARFRAWRGASGRRFIFTVFDPELCPAYCNAVLIVVAIDSEGGAAPLALLDTGTLPEPVLSRATRIHSGGKAKIQFHLHLLADSAAERISILEDLRLAN